MARSVVVICYWGLKPVYVRTTFTHAHYSIHFRFRPNTFHQPLEKKQTSPECQTAWIRMRRRVTRRFIRTQDVCLYILLYTLKVGQKRVCDVKTLIRVSFSSGSTLYPFRLVLHCIYSPLRCVYLSCIFSL